MTIKKLVQVKGVFTPLIRTKLSPRIAYKIFKLIKAIEFEENFLNEKLKIILKEYAQTDEKGNFVYDEKGNICLIKGKEEDCNNAINELNDIEVDKPNFNFTLDELDSLSLSVIDMAIIEDFIIEEE